MIQGKEERKRERKGEASHRRVEKGEERTDPCGQKKNVYIGMCVKKKIALQELLISQLKKGRKKK